jgi:eukaryotic-like serine/threonine-protein kinase
MEVRHQGLGEFLSGGASGMVYFESYDGNFYALEAATGQLKWKFQTAGERHYAGTHLHGMQPAAESMPDPWDFFLSSPSVWNGTVYFGSGDSNSYALDANSGALKWEFKTGDVVHSSPAIADGTLFIGSWDSYLYALDAATGREKWRFKTGEDPDLHNHVGIQASLAIADGSARWTPRLARCWFIGRERHRSSHPWPLLPTNSISATFPAN